MPKFPIHFIALDGVPTDQVVAGAPCLRVGFFHDSNPDDGQLKIADGHWALIDTGADYCYADPTVLAAAGSPRVGDAGDVNGEGSAGVFLGSLAFQSPSFTVETIFIERDFLREGQAPYLIVLGRQFLQLGRLYFDLGTPDSGCYFDIDLNRLGPQNSPPVGGQ